MSSNGPAFENYHGLIETKYDLFRVNAAYGAQNWGHFHQWIVHDTRKYTNEYIRSTLILGTTTCIREILKTIVSRGFLKNAKLYRGKFFLQVSL